jgi:hypothetical protein
MKKQLLTLLFAISTVISFSQVPSYVPTNGLVGYWPFNGNANDESGNGNNGTVNGATLTTDRFNSLNLAYHLDGNGDNIYVANSLFDNGSVGFSLSIWYNLDQFQNPNNGNSSHILFNTSPHNGLGLDMNWSGSSKYSIFLGNGTPANSWNTSIFNSESNQNIAINSWHNVVLVKSGNTYSLYIDGVFDINWISNTTISPYFYKMYFGAADPDVSNEVIIGDIDDIGIWNRILTQQEITDLYNSCSNPSATITPQGNTTFCQGGSVNLIASTGSNYTYEWYKDGQLINGAITNIYQVTSSGNYTVKVIDGPCYATSSATNVTVNANPTVTLNSIPAYSLKTSAPIQLVGNPTGGTFSGEAVSGSTFTPANASLGQKVISYSYTSQQGCSGSASQTTIVADTVGNVCSTYDTLIITVHFTTGINANTSNSIKFYPNPTNDILNIDNGNYQAMSGYSIKIVSLTGAVIYNQPITTQSVQISMNDFGTTGLYFAQIIDPNNAIVDSKKIVLQ